jgi:autotransporter strand-loop-strand O-heptosyltransferase
MLKKLGYSVVTLTKKKYNIKGNINIYKRSLDESINLLYHAQFMVGISSGLSWLNWSLGKHTFLISGFTPKNHEFTTNITRIINEHSCNSCWANTNFSFDAGDWNWCPIWKGTDKQHICQKSISPISVYNEIENYLK